jgi:hypothetical protein
MCTTRYYKSRNCDDQWVVIDTPCGYGKGFSTCDTFTDKHFFAGNPKLYAASRDDCPWHGLRGSYDFNRIRMVESVRTRYSICSPPAGPKAPMSVVCCVIQ